MFRCVDRFIFLFVLGLELCSSPLRKRFLPRFFMRFVFMIRQEKVFIFFIVSPQYIISVVLVNTFRMFVYVGAPYFAPRIFLHLEPHSFVARE